MIYVHSQFLVGSSSFFIVILNVELNLVNSLSFGLIDDFFEKVGKNSLSSVFLLDEDRLDPPRLVVLIGDQKTSAYFI